VIKQHGNPLKVLELVKQDRPRVSAPHNVVLGVLASTVNPADINVVEGVYPVRPKLPGTGGIDGAGIVLEVGSAVTDLKPGDYVWPYSQKLGMFQTYVECHEKFLTKADPRLSLVQLATLQANPVTAYRMIKKGDLKAGDTLIQNAGNGAVGQNVIQIAHAWGIKTINIVRSVYADLADIKRWMTEMGADHILTDVEINNQELTKEVLKHVARPKLFLNCVGGEQVMKVSYMLENGALILTYGGMSLKPVMIPTAALVFKGQRYIGFYLTEHEFKLDDPEESRIWRGALKEVSELAVQGKLRPPLVDMKPCTEWVQAFDVKWRQGHHLEHDAHGHTHKGEEPHEVVTHEAKKILTWYDPKKGD
jgi:trans-2-enoyl-CoA reductase